MYPQSFKEGPQPSCPPSSFRLNPDLMRSKGDLTRNKVALQLIKVSKVFLKCMTFSFPLRSLSLRSRELVTPRPRASNRLEPGRNGKSVLPFLQKSPQNKVAEATYRRRRASCLSVRYPTVSAYLLEPVQVQA